jgi:exonuclease III
MAQTKKYHLHTIAFYNFENLFDSKNDSNDDDDWTPRGEQHWTEAKYKRKLENLAQVLSGIGTNEKNAASPSLIGCCEIENRGVLEDLVKQNLVIDSDYGIVHFDSPDKRGIDVALLYRKKHFKVTHSENIPLLLHEDNDEKKERVFTRDVLHVIGLLDGEEVHILVNHWPSRSSGEKKTSPYREAAASLDKQIIDAIYEKNPKAKIICMGDLNDGTTNKSVKINLDAKRTKEEVKEFGIYNPFEQMEKEGHATLYHNDTGAIFDQIMVSQTLIDRDFSKYQFWKAGIYNKSFMIQQHGKYRGYPKRNIDNEVGYSDHFPVYIYLIKEAQ